jgi:hypothetical protein
VNARVENSDDVCGLSDFSHRLQARYLQLCVPGQSPGERGDKQSRQSRRLRQTTRIVQKFGKTVNAFMDNLCFMGIARHGTDGYRVQNGR